MRKNKFKILAFTAGAVILFLFGFLSADAKIFPYNYVKMILTVVTHGENANSGEAQTPQGRWHLARQAGADDAPVDDKRQEAIKKLSTLGYLDGYTPADGASGVTVYNKEQAFPGLNLISSGHYSEAVLIDMQGKIVHKWSKDISEVDFYAQLEGNPLKRAQEGGALWLHVELGQNGDLFAIFEDYGIVKLDRNSNVMWSHFGKNHHDLDVAKNANIYVLARQRRKVADEMSLFTWTTGDTVIADDLITILTPDGEEIRRISLLDCFLNSPHASLLEHFKRKRDVFHSNSLTLIEDDRHIARVPFFRKGTALVSMRNIHAIAVIDLAKEQVIWSMTGMWKFQHDPVILEDGNILIFDNMGNNGNARALEINPLTQEVMWSYGNTPEEEFVTVTCGGNQRLPNGNTLITESENGRAFEVTPDGKIVWEYRSPHRAGEKDELVATLYKVVRTHPETVKSFVDITTADL